MMGHIYKVTFAKSVTRPAKHAITAKIALPVPTDFKRISRGYAKSVQEVRKWEISLAKNIT